MEREREIKQQTANCLKYDGRSRSTLAKVDSFKCKCHRRWLHGWRLYYVCPMAQGGAPEGPAGTGKTETVKELARYTGKQFVLYNCTESLDMTAIVKILAGAVSTGAWACFDEFNRLAQGVLSVLAKHILTIQTELIAGSSRVSPTLCHGHA